MGCHGFRYDRSAYDTDGSPLVMIRYGEVGRQMLQAHQASVAALVTNGCSVVIDEMLLAPEVLRGWLDVLADVDVLFVGVHCPLPVLEVREIGRRSPRGLARGHLRTVHTGAHYDVEVDTGSGDPDVLANLILARCAVGDRRSAFAEMRQQLLRPDVWPRREANER